MPQCSHLAIALIKFDGGLHYEDTFVGLSLDEIMDLGSTIHTPLTIPFARDSEDRILCVQMIPGEGEVVVIMDQGQILEIKHMTFGTYLESIRKWLLTGQLCYSEGLGLLSIA